MDKAPRYLLTDQFDLGMVASLPACIHLTEISLESVCQLIEEADREKSMGLHGGWSDAVKDRQLSRLTSAGPVLLVARLGPADDGMVVKWIQVSVVDCPTLAALHPSD